MTAVLHELRAPLVSVDGVGRLLAALMKRPDSADHTLCIARNLSTHEYLAEMANVVHVSQGYHFNVKRMSHSQVMDFSNPAVASDLRRKCPKLWRLFQLLLGASPSYADASKAIRSDDYITKTLPHDNVLCSNVEIDSEGVQRSDEDGGSDAGDLEDEDWSGDSDEEEEETQRQRGKRNSKNAVRHRRNAKGVVSRFKT